MPPKKSPYSKRCMKAARADRRMGPAITYMENLSPEDIGLPMEFKCIIWLVYASRYAIVFCADTCVCVWGVGSWRRGRQTAVGGWNRDFRCFVGGRIVGTFRDLATTSLYTEILNILTVLDRTKKVTPLSTTSISTQIPEGCHFLSTPYGV